MDEAKSPREFSGDKHRIQPVRVRDRQDHRPRRTQFHPRAFLRAWLRILQVRTTLQPSRGAF